MPSYECFSINLDGLPSGWMFVLSGQDIRGGCYRWGQMREACFARRGGGMMLWGASFFVLGLTVILNTSL